MKYYIFKLIKRTNGAASIEVTISLTAFIFVIITIYTVINLCVVQAMMARAINTCAKEISQYAYVYYKISQENSDLQQSLDAVIGMNTYIYDSTPLVINSEIHSLSELMSLLEDSKDLDKSEIYKELQTARSLASEVINDPYSLMKTLALLSKKELTDSMSRIIAVTVSKGLTRRHFGNTLSEANSKLSNMGVVDGYDGVNFNLSEFLSPDDPENISIVAVYNINISSIFPFDYSITVKQRAYARAWLGGDTSAWSLAEGDDDE